MQIDRICVINEHSNVDRLRTNTISCRPSHCAYCVCSHSTVQPSSPTQGELLNFNYWRGSSKASLQKLLHVIALSSIYIVCPLFVYRPKRINDYTAHSSPSVSSLLSGSRFASKLKWRKGEQNDHVLLACTREHVHVRLPERDERRKAQCQLGSKLILCPKLSSLMQTPLSSLLLSFLQLVSYKWVVELRLPFEGQGQDWCTKGAFRELPSFFLSLSSFSLTDLFLAAARFLSPSLDKLHTLHTAHCAVTALLGHISTFAWRN